MTFLFLVEVCEAISHIVDSTLDDLYSIQTSSNGNIATQAFGKGHGSWKPSADDRNIFYQIELTDITGYESRITSVEAEIANANTMYLDVGYMDNGNKHLVANRSQVSTKHYIT